MADHHHHLTSTISGSKNTTMSTNNKNAPTIDQTSSLHMSKKWKNKDDASPEPPPKHKEEAKRVAVVYYLSRNGNLQQPHFIEVPLSSPDGLYLRDVINRLNSLRGKGIAGLYSWSCKRSYKSGFVWQDLEENDFIYPAHGQEYVLKGSERLVDSASPLISKSDETVTSHSEHQSPECKLTGEDSDFPVVRRRRNQSWSAIDLHEYNVYKSDSTGASVSRAAADASTQTDDKRWRRRTVIRDIDEEEEEEQNIREEKSESTSTTELSRDEFSPPPSDSSSETLEKAVVTKPPAPAPERLKASAVLMQLITCGSVSFSDCGPSAYGKNLPGFSLISQYNERLPRGGGQNQVKKETGEANVGSRSFNFRGIRRNKVKKKVLEDKEYFSGSLIETKKDQFPVLQRSSSFNAHR